MKSALLRIGCIASVLVVLSVLYLLSYSAPAYAASLSLSPATASKNINDSFGVDIVLDTEGVPVSGATAMINYDVTKLQVVDDDATATGVQIKPGTILTQTLANSVDATAGQIRFDAGTLGASFTGRGVMGTIHFKAIAEGSAQATFVFNPSATTNTSAVAAASGPNNLLTTVNDGTFTIGATSTQPLPKTGAVEDTILMLFGGLSLLGGGIYFGKKAQIFIK